MSVSTTATWLALVLSAAVPDDMRRVTFRVEPGALRGRARDERPALARLLASGYDPRRRIDPASIQVVRYDPTADRELTGPLPFRWYDDSIPWDFPECEQNVHATDGVSLAFVNHPRWGDFYNVLGDGFGGRLVWTHTQKGGSPAFYAVSFRLLPEGVRPERLPPRGLVGDGSHRCAPAGSGTTGMIHSRVSTTDWDGDGLTDLLVGGARGQVLFYPNRGTKSAPRYPFARLVTTSDGRPLDVGWSAAPLTVDWDGDGATDLLCGAERNRILFFRNTGRPAWLPKLENRGFVTVGGRPLALPVEPVPKAPAGVFTLDYYPVFDVADWDGDGRGDLLAGGFITGRVYLFRNAGTNPDGTPHLEAHSPIVADDRPLNVGDWAAAPCAADLDGDGDLDLVCGNMPMTTGGGDSSDREHFLRYYENLGGRTAPRLAERAFPCEGTFPNAALGTPRAADLNGDGLSDLAVSSGENIYLYFNVGTRAKPRFAVNDRPLPSVWGSMPLPVSGLQFLDWDGDGIRDILGGRTIYLGRTGGDFSTVPLLRPDNPIDHSVPRGDAYAFTHLADMDRDGRPDLLWGTHEGNVWLHHNEGGKPPRFDSRGVQLVTADGRPIRVGPAETSPMDFDMLQGARTTLAAADFDGDGRLDLVIGDTYGKVRHFRNLGPGHASTPRFAAAVELAALGIRVQPFAADWDRDGRVDVVASAASGRVVLLRNLGGGRFDAPEAMRVPDVPYSPYASVVDWNGDGDDDLLVGTAYGYTCLFERSFLDHGYAPAQRAD
jgi:hypothetical protein